MQQRRGRFSLGMADFFSSFFFVFFFHFLPFFSYFTNRPPPPPPPLRTGGQSTIFTYVFIPLFTLWYLLDMIIEVYAHYICISYRRVSRKKRNENVTARITFFPIFLRLSVSARVCAGNKCSRCIIIIIIVFWRYTVVLFNITAEHKIQ